jgi:two-component system response regulator AlgR
MTHSVLIVDDEPLARKRLARLLARIDGYRLVGEAGNGSEAVAACQSLKPAIVLMDIRMPGMDGLEACRHITATEQPPAIIFCTAYDDYALQAFDSEAVGYLLKPARREALEGALQRARRVNRLQLSALQQATQEQRRHLSANTPHGLKLVPVDEVRLLFAEQKYVTACSPDGELLVDDSLKELETEFGDRFVRVHRNALVSRRHILGLDKHDEEQVRVRLQGIDRCPQVSRRHLAALRKLLKEL